MLVDNDGSDLIFLTGAPGSKWSSVHRQLSMSPDINSSDITSDRQYSHKVGNSNNPINSKPNHIGVYLGPYNQLGEKLDYLHNCSKDYLLQEFSKGFESFDGTKIIKSHWFAYNLPYLKNLFPKAKFVLCYRNEIECFSWWHQCGGWGITYPNYTWYQNDTRLLNKIKEENYNILKFAMDNQVNFKYPTVEELLNSLNIQLGEKHQPTATFTCKISIVH